MYMNKSKLNNRTEINLLIIIIITIEINWNVVTIGTVQITSERKVLQNKTKKLL